MAIPAYYMTKDVNKKVDKLEKRVHVLELWIKNINKKLETNGIK